MNRKFHSVLLIALLIGIQPVLAQQDEETVNLEAVSDDELSQAEEATATEAEPVLAEEPSVERPSATITEEEIPQNIRFNEYYLESERLAKLAQETYNYGDYDASATIAREAIHYALLSDVYVAMALAKSRLDWAVASGTSLQYPVEYREAETWYNESLSAQDAEEWDNALEAAYKVIDVLAYISAPEGTFTLPAKYTVRSWITVKDCLWNIAGRPWVYNNPHQWRLLYNANRSKLPDPNNPNLIEPGMVLDIPSIRGETRRGEWSSTQTYPSVR